MYGYVLARKSNDRVIAKQHKEIALFCIQQHLRLEVIFTDRDIPDETTVRPGLIGLLDVLAFPDTHGVVVTSLDDLSSKATTRAQLYRLIKATGSVVIEVHDEPDHSLETTVQEAMPDE
ncbi:recombinase family protein [Lentzea sp. NPDC051838]|uniref:recombinase family protein n=1 Tax=Lentzea sp. NPDC051838 TaxID=3154849 RepID=UPI003418955F